MNEYDERQFKLMLVKIEAFNEGYLHLSDLINDLKALLDLTAPDQAWDETFFSYWLNLEEVYAVALDEEKSYLDPDDVKIVNDAVMNLKNMVELKLKMHDQERLMNIANKFITPQEWPSLRGVIAYWENQTLNIAFYFGQKITEQSKENAEILATEIIAQFSEGLLSEKYIYLESSHPLPVSSFWIYKNINEI